MVILLESDKEVAKTMQQKEGLADKLRAQIDKLNRDTNKYQFWMKLIVLQPFELNR